MNYRQMQLVWCLTFNLAAATAMGMGTNWWIGMGTFWALFAIHSMMLASK